MADVTDILSLIDNGNRGAASDLLPLVYDELRKLAAQRLTKERPGQTLSATALVHEAYLRLVDVKRAQTFNSRGHFFAAAAEAMRRIMVEKARHKQTKKRSAHRIEIDPDSAAWHLDIAPDDTLAVDDVLDQLAEEDPDAANLAKLHVFSGFSVEEAAQLLEIPRSTAYRTWKFARAWLSHRLSP